MRAWGRESRAVADADFVFTCVGNDDDLRSVTIGPDGAFAGMKSGAVFVDHTTASAAVARELSANARHQGLHFVDAPVSGGQAGAQNGMLTVMCGGPSAAFEAAKPVKGAVDLGKLQDEEEKKKRQQDAATAVP